MARLRSVEQARVRLLWETRRFLRSAGWTTVLAAGCALLAVLVAWDSQRVAQRRLELAAQLRAAREAKPASGVNGANQHDIARQVAAFYAYLPRHEAIPDLLKQLINQAEKNGVTLVQAEYRPEPQVGAAFLRYHIALPVKAGYPAVESFVAGALREMPTLTLASIVFKRERIESAEVEARIHFVLLVAQPTGGAQ